MSILSLNQSEFAELMVSLLGKGRHHAERLYQEWMRRGSVSDLSWVEPQAKALVQQIIVAADWRFDPVSNSLEEGEVSKFLVKLQDQLESESVIIPMKAGLTLCVSSQVGCRMGCAFCETGRMGLIRNLTVQEIIQQLFISIHVLKWPIRNVVFMWMGEPLDNYEIVMKAFVVMID